MNKRQREAAERNMLKHILDSKPEYKKIMDGLIDKHDKNLRDAIQPVIEEELKKARLTGIQIGWQTAFIQAYEKVKDMQDIEEIKTCLKGEADKVRDRLGLKPHDQERAEESSE